MITGILGKKVGMTQLFDDKGDVRPVTVLQAGPCVITQKKSAAKDGYDAVQVGLVEFVKGTRVTKPMAGHFAKHDLAPVKAMRAFSIITADAHTESDAPTVGDTAVADSLTEAKLVVVTGTRNGPRFAGV